MQNDRFEISNAILDEFAQWCSSRYVDQQLRDFKIYKSLNKVGEE